MSERNNRCCSDNPRESVCIDTNRVYDSCKDRDCMEDMRVYLNAADQLILDSSVNIKPIEAEILCTFIDVEPLQFNKGFYTVDIRFFIKSAYDAFTGPFRPQRIEGLSVFEKRVILFGSEGEARTFSSLYVNDGPDIPLSPRTNMPIATVEVLDPILLSARAVDACENCGCCCCDLASIPQSVNSVFEGLSDPENGKRLYATMGIFSIVRLMRKVQIIVPSFDFCIPEKECCGPTEEDPCSLFYRMSFPVNEFFPPRLSDFETENENGTGCGCGCGGNNR